MGDLKKQGQQKREVGLHRQKTSNSRAGLRQILIEI